MESKPRRVRDVCKKIKIGDHVATCKGGRFHYEGPFAGVVVGFSKWKNCDAVSIKKDSNGKIVQCLVKNILHTSELKQ